MKVFVACICPLIVAASLFAQDRELIAAAPEIKQQIKLTEKKKIAVSFLTNTQGYASNFSDFVGDTLSSLLAGPDLPFAVVTRKYLAQIRGEQINRASKDFDPNSFAELGKLTGADAIITGSYIVYETNVSLNIQLIDVSDGRILFGEIILIPKTPLVRELLLGPKPASQGESRGQAHPTDPVLSNHSLEIGGQAGLSAIEWGSFTKDEDDRLRAAIKSAKSIKMLMPNGSNVTYTFRKEFQDFFSKPDSSMQVIFARPDSDFYREETEMTNVFRFDTPDIKKTLDANRGLVEVSRARLVGYARDQGQVRVRYFDTQFRLPIIIVDDKLCDITIRLSPNESPQSLRLEFSAASDSFVNACVAHFNRMWVVSSSGPEEKKP